MATQIISDCLSSSGRPGAGALPPALPDPGEDFSGIELQEPQLIVSRRMEDQVGKTKLYIRTNLLKVLINVVGDEPAAMSLIRHLRSIRLHLARIVDIRLVFGRERQRGPDARISISAFEIGVEGYLDLDHALNGSRVTACGLRAFLKRRQQLIAVELVTFAGGTDKPITFAASEPGRDWPTSADIDGYGFIRTVINGGIARMVVLAIESNEFLGPKPADQFNSFAEPGQALFGRRPCYARRRYFIERLTGTNTQDHAARVEHTQCSKRLRDNRRRIAERGSEHARAQQNTLGSLSGCAQPGEGKGGMPVRVPPGLEMVAYPDAFEAARLGLYGKVQELARTKLFSRCLIAEFQFAIRLP